jgi:hypothetical protein
LFCVLFTFMPHEPSAALIGGYRAARRPVRHCPQRRAWTRPPKPGWRYPDWRHHGERRRVKLSTAEPVKAARLAT